MLTVTAKLIPHIKSWRALLVFAFMLHAFGTSVAQSQKSAQALLRLNYLATGGDQWKGLAQANLAGDLNLAGAAGSFNQVVDLKDGRDATTFDAGPIHIEQVTLTNSSWQLDGSGLVTYADTPDAKADAITQSFIDRNGWFTASAAELKYLGIKQDQGKRFELVSVTPPGGRSITLWLGAVDHLIHRLDQLDASHQQSSIFFSEYRRTTGVLVPYSVRQSNGTVNEDTIQTVRTVRLLPKVDGATFVAPSSLFRDASLPLGQDSAVIPFTLTDGRICVQVSIDGHAPLPFLLDSGAANYITPEAAKSVGLKGSGNVALGGTGEDQSNGQFAKVDKLRLGPIEMMSQQFVIGSLPKFLQDRGHQAPLAGLIGAELLRRFPTTFDYEKKALTCYRPGSVPPHRSDAQELKLLFNGGHPFIQLQTLPSLGALGRQLSTTGVVSA